MDCPVRSYRRTRWQCYTTPTTTQSTRGVLRTSGINAPVVLRTLTWILSATTAAQGTKTKTARHPNRCLLTQSRTVAQATRLGRPVKPNFYRRKNMLNIGQKVMLIGCDNYMPPLGAIGEIAGYEDGCYDVLFPKYPCPVPPGVTWCALPRWLMPLDDGATAPEKVMRHAA